MKTKSPPVLPDKHYFRIGEVSQIVGVKPYVLRYWETEFQGIRPTKSPSNQRLYRRTDVELLLEIKRLVHEERFTIEGARRLLKTSREERSSEESPGSILEQVMTVQKGLRSILELLEKPID